MKGRAILLMLAVLAALLMCGALVVCEADDAEPAAIELPQAGVITLPPVQDPLGAPSPTASRPAAARIEARQARVRPSFSADANGTPILRTTYARSNWRAFHYPDKAG